MTVHITYYNFGEYLYMHQSEIKTGIQFNFHPEKWTIGIQWRKKPRSLWIYIPMCIWYIPLGVTCPYCKGQGGWSIEAGDGSWYDECESCDGKGVK